MAAPDPALPPPAGRDAEGHVVPAGIRPATPYLYELESLRGWAIALVFLHHVDLFFSMDRHGGPLTPPSTTTLLHSLVRGGHTGVTLFFLLSGFLLTQPLITAARGGRAPNWGRYFERRALRILPLYYAAVLVASLASAAAPREVLRGVPYLFFLNSFPGGDTPLWPYSAVWWSLATEVQFYLLLPLVATLLLWRRGRWLVWLGAVAWATGYWFLLIGGRLGSIEAQMKLALSIFGRAPVFMLGAAAAWLFVRHGDAIRRAGGVAALRRSGGADLALAALVLGLARLLQWVCSVGYLQAEFPPFVAWHLLEALLWVSILLLLLLVRPYATPLLCNPLAGAIGVLSYSIYVIHFPFLAFILQPGTGWLSASVDHWSAAGAALTVVLFVLCSVLAALTYRGIERPFLVRKAAT